MRYYLILIGMVCSVLVCAQKKAHKDTVLTTAILSLQAKIDFRNNIVQLTPLSSDSISFLNNLHIQLSGGDIIINYNLKEEAIGDFAINLIEVRNLSTDSSLFDLKAEFLFGDHNKVFLRRKDTQNKIILANTPDNDNLKWLNGEIQFKLKIVNSIIKIGDYVADCDDPAPKLYLKKFTFEMTTGIAGIATLWTGIKMDNQSDRIYKVYGNSDNKVDADPIYETANKKYKEALITKTIGVGIIATSVVSTFIKLNNHRQNKKYYQQYCKLSMRPYYNPQSTLAAPYGQTGLSFIYKF